MSTLRASAFGGIAIVGLIAGCAKTTSPEPTSTADDEAAIAEFNKRYLGAINDGDAATLASLTTEEHMMIMPGRPPIVGKKANDEANARMLANTDIDETWTPEETEISGNLAYQRGTFTVAATPKSGGDTRKVSGTFLRIYKKQPDGSWRMTRDMFNTDSPGGLGMSPAPPANP